MRIKQKPALCTVLFLLIPIVFLPAQEDDLDTALYAVGQLGGANLYFTYLTLGTVADGYVGGGYTADTASSLADDAINLSKGAIDSLQRIVDELTISRDDRDTIKKMIASYELLIGQANGLKSYIDDPEQSADYQTYREKAWKSIADLLQIQ
jgi:hypothetical protein